MKTSLPPDSTEPVGVGWGAMQKCAQMSIKEEAFSLEQDAHSTVFGGKRSREGKLVTCASSTRHTTVSGL